eukprot:scaffold248359_cov45-Cyclotella_meneghiniana.AAC.2
MKETPLSSTRLLRTCCNVPASPSVLEYECKTGWDTQWLPPEDGSVTNPGLHVMIPKSASLPPHSSKSNDNVKEPDNASSISWHASPTFKPIQAELSTPLPAVKIISPLESTSTSVPMKLPRDLEITLLAAVKSKSTLGIDVQDKSRVTSTSRLSTQ